MSHIASANDWVVKAGGRFIDQTNILLPHNFLMVPMSLASEAVVEFRKTDVLTERIKHGLVVVLMVRVADTAFFNRVAKMIYEHNEKKIKMCQHCLRGQLWPTKMKEYRQEANKKIIHKMEEGYFIPPEDLSVVEDYYEEIFKHPLVNPITWGDVKNIQRCDRCSRQRT